MTAAGNALGAWGERQVAAWYAARGYEVLARNWRAPGGRGELDLVLARGGVVVFCEVKTRRSDRFGSPLEAVTPAKQVRLRRLAATWLAATGGGWRAVRFDAAGVSGRRIDVVEAAF